MRIKARFSFDIRVHRSQPGQWPFVAATTKAIVYLAATGLM